MFPQSDEDRETWQRNSACQVPGQQPNSKENHKRHDFGDI
jgi:hypothetical protein